MVPGPLHAHINTAKCRDGVTVICYWSRPKISGAFLWASVTIVQSALILKSCCFKNQWASATNYRKSMSCPFSRFCIFPICHSSFAMDWQHGFIAITHSQPPPRLLLRSPQGRLCHVKFLVMIFTIPDLSPQHWPYNQIGAVCSENNFFKINKLIN